jgi:small conductance mechanosensitive channel
MVRGYRWHSRLAGRRPIGWQSDEQGPEGVPTVFWQRRPAAAVAAFSDARELIFRPKFRKALIAGAVFVVATSICVGFGGVEAKHRVSGVLRPDHTHQLGAVIALIVTIVSGLITVRLTANEISRLARHRGSPAAASGLKLTIQIVGYLVVLIVVLGLLAVKVESVLLSGAIGSVVIGLAAQQSLGNAFAGIVLLVSRPFVVGDYITLRAGALGGQYDGDVIAISLMFTTLSTLEGPMLLPNAAVLASATGRRDRPATGGLVR